VLLLINDNDDNVDDDTNDEDDAAKAGRMIMTTTTTEKKKKKKKHLPVVLSYVRTPPCLFLGARLIRQRKQTRQYVFVREPEKNRHTVCVWFY
jgi:hypothetical protein